MPLRAHTAADNFPSPTARQQAELIRHLRDHLLTDREGYVSLSQLAAEHNISVSHLQKLFKQVYGVPVYHYIKAMLGAIGGCGAQSAQERDADRAERGLRQRQQVFRMLQKALRRYSDAVPSPCKERVKTGQLNQNGVVIRRDMW